MPIPLSPDYDAVGHRLVAVGSVADGTMDEATASVACYYAAIAPPVISAQVVKA